MGTPKKGSVTFGIPYISGALCPQALRSPRSSAGFQELPRTRLGIIDLITGSSTTSWDHGVPHGFREHSRKGLQKGPTGRKNGKW